MQKTSIHTTHPKHLNQTLPPAKTSTNPSKDSLFACRKQKNLFIQKLKKGTLFRLGHHLRPEVKLQLKDPFLGWLEENSRYDLGDSLEKREMGETYFYVDEGEIAKQKKLFKSTLPAIQKFKSSHGNTKSNLSPKSTHNCSFHLNTLSPHSLDLPSKQQRTSNKLNPLNLHPRLHPLKPQKHHCYEDILSKTQMFPTSLHHSFYENNQALIHSQFYLNGHKKKEAFLQTFYMKPKLQQEEDHDLRRVNGLGIRKVKKFEENLFRLKKEVGMSCYDEVKGYFQKMKGQVRELMDRAQDTTKKNKKQRRTYNDKRHSPVCRQQKSENRITSKRHNQENKNQNLLENSPKTTTKSTYLPEFLLKSLILPAKGRSIQEEKANGQSMMIRG